MKEHEQISRDRKARPKIEYFEVQPKRDKASLIGIWLAVALLVYLVASPFIDLG